MLEEYNYQITHREDKLPITKISYIINSSKEASVRITKGNDPLNVKVYERFRLKILGFNEWLEVHALASKGKDNKELASTDLLEGGCQWLIGVSADERKRKRSEMLKEVFGQEDITMDGMHINLTLPPGIEGSRGRVITEPESMIFFYNEGYSRGRGMDLTIEAKDDVNQARIIVKDNLDDGGMYES
ncbi:hypothetical protein Tco_1418496 [Tanacetum coccineum]